MIDPNPLNRPKAIEVLNDPAIKQYKRRRLLLLTKHRIVSFPKHAKSQSIEQFT
jgi:hypothetical protein